MLAEHTLIHLRESLEELQRTIRECESDPAYDDGAFFVAMQHLYGHLNTAWNTRHLDPDRVSSMSDAEFHEWRAFPTDLDLTS